MQAYLEAQGDDIWEAVENGPYIPTTVINNKEEIKIKNSWTDEDKRKVLFDKKAKNILQSALGMDEFFRISHCKTAKEIWDTLEVTHEGTIEVKRSKLNTLSQEYELFRMQPGESILDLQKRFSHLTNHLTALGKIFTNDELNLKVLRLLTRAWQPKVTAISEKKSLSKMSLSALFGKLQEHEIELGRLEQNESQEKKNKNIALKTESREQSKENDSDEDENIILLVKKFGKFLKNDRTFKKKSFKKKDNSTSNQNFTCFECGKQGHIKADCPNIAKKNFNRKKDFKKAYIAWEDNEVSSSSETESEECANVALMASHQSDDEEVSNIDSPLYNKTNNELIIEYNDAQNAIKELLIECKNLCKLVSTQKKQISSLQEKIDIMEKNSEKLKQNSACNKCKSLSFEIVQLNRVIERYEKGQLGLENVLNMQRYSNDKSGLGYSKFDKPNLNKTIFVKASSQSNQEKIIVMKKDDLYNKKIIQNKSHTYVTNSRFNPTCSYCGLHGHTPNTCHIRNISVPKGHFIWVKKGTNHQGPKAHWVPNKV